MSGTWRHTGHILQRWYPIFVQKGTFVGHYGCPELGHQMDIINVRNFREIGHPKVVQKMSAFFEMGHISDFFCPEFNFDSDIMWTFLSVRPKSKSGQKMSEKCPVSICADIFRTFFRCPNFAGLLLCCYSIFISCFPIVFLYNFILLLHKIIVCVEEKPSYNFFWYKRKLLL